MSETQDPRSVEEHVEHEEHLHHVTPLPMLVKTIVVLFVLMALTVAAAYLNVIGIHLEIWFAQIIAIAIAVTKAALVVWIFMGTRHGTKLIRVFAFGGFIWMLLIFGTFLDYFTRDSEPVLGWEPTEQTALPRSAAERHTIGDEVDQLH